jgi:hypothetical protein
MHPTTRSKKFPAPNFKAKNTNIKEKATAESHNPNKEPTKNKIERK